jgi:hypothetical protein
MRRGFFICGTSGTSDMSADLALLSGTTAYLSFKDIMVEDGAEYLSKASRSIFGVLRTSKSLGKLLCQKEGRI